MVMTPETTRDLGDLKYRIVRDDSQIALQHQAERHAKCVAVYRCNDRFRVPGLAQPPGTNATIWTAKAFKLLPRFQLALIDVGTGGEGSAGAAHDGHPGRVVIVEALPGLAERDDRGIRECVQLVRSIETNMSDLAYSLIENEFLGI